MWVTRPPAWATQLRSVSKSPLKMYTLPWMSATSVPRDVEVMHEISGAFYGGLSEWSEAMEGEGACLEYLWGACKVMDVLDRRDVKERELPPLHELVSHTSSLSERND